MLTGLNRILLGNFLKRYRNHFPCHASRGCIRTQRKLPEDGWPDNRIEMLLGELSLMDSNNFPGMASHVGT